MDQVSKKKEKKNKKNNSFSSFCAILIGIFHDFQSVTGAISKNRDICLKFRKFEEKVYSITGNLGFGFCVPNAALAMYHYWKPSLSYV